MATFAKYFYNWREIFVKKGLKKTKGLSCYFKGTWKIRIVVKFFICIYSDITN